MPSGNDNFENNKNPSCVDNSKHARRGFFGFSIHLTLDGRFL